MKNGVPFDVAFSLEDEEAFAYGIVFGEFEGGSWDWNIMDWSKKDN